MTQLWLFWVAPILGALLAGFVYTWLVGDDEPDVTGRDADAGGPSEVAGRSNDDVDVIGVTIRYSEVRSSSTNFNLLRKGARVVELAALEML